MGKKQDAPRVLYLLEFIPVKGNYLVADYPKTPYLFCNDVARAAHFFTRDAADEMAKMLGVKANCGVHPREMKGA